MRRNAGSGKGLALVLALAAAAAAHETDQFTVPLGMEFADIGDHITAIYYDGIESGVRTANERIRRAIKAGRDPAYIERLQSPDVVVDDVYANYAAAIFMIEGTDQYVHRNPDTMRRHPGRLPGYWESVHNIFTGAYFPLDPRQLFRIWHSCTLKAYGVYFGTDKLGHFTDMGYVYYTIRRDAIAAGAGEEAWHARVLAEASGGLILGEKGMLGYLSSGVYSNADLAANYAGMKFYLNLTRPVCIGGEMRPPMLRWDGQAWETAPRVRRDSDFFRPFVSDHWNEALNPGLCQPGLRAGVREAVRRRADRVLDFYHDANGARRSRAWFEATRRSLATWYGEDYGHQGGEEELVSVDRTCFEPPPGDGGDPSARNAAGWTWLHWGAMTGDRALVIEALDGGCGVDVPIQSLAARSSEWGNRPLHVAAAAGRAGIVELLLDRGADVNTVNGRGEPPLHLAIDHPAVVTILLGRGAEVNARDEQGRTALHWAGRSRQGDTAALLILNGADVTARDHLGRSPLHEAAGRGDQATMTALLAAGADVDAKARFDTTPLHFAARCDDSGAIDLLASHGAHVDARDEFGVTPLHDAAHRGWLAGARALLAAGAAVDAADDGGSTPLHVAARRGHDAVAGLLMAAGGDVNRPNDIGSYPLHEAVFGGRNSTIDMLLAAGADPTLRNSRGRSPIEVASAKGNSPAALRMSASQAAATTHEHTMGLN